jgi:hypothetical protein
MALNTLSQNVAKEQAIQNIEELIVQLKEDPTARFMVMIVSVQQNPNEHAEGHLVDTHTQVAVETWDFPKEAWQPVAKQLYEHTSAALGADFNTRPLPAADLSRFPSRDPVVDRIVKKAAEQVPPVEN